MAARNRVLQQLSSILKDRGLAFELEHAIYSYAINNDYTYKREALRALYMLKDHKWIQFIYEKGAAVFAAMPAEHNPSGDDIDMIHIAKNCEERLLAISERDDVQLPEAGTKCSKCGSTDISFSFLQTRAADEGTSVFCTCEKCGKRWKMG
jgi:DNA-directed RNA polymerase subunit M/transcription elongation factor TFIIS